MNVKRVLWIEDNEKSLNDSIRELFNNVEKKSIDSMHKAIDEMSSKRLYNYDTVVLDIDFRDDNRSDFEYVISKLKERIYLKKDQCQKNSEGEYAFIKENGGYLLFLYLLERGYPSDRIAFLTGNDDIIEKLRIYTEMNKEERSREEIFSLFTEKWNEVEGDYEEFEAIIIKMTSLEREFRATDFLETCEELLERNDYDELLSTIKSVSIATYESQADNPKKYENDMIFRFHRANLKSPEYFSKHENDISEHNLEDAKKWMDEKRSTDKVFRWLALNASAYIEDQWKDENNAMTRKIRKVLYIRGDDNPSYDFGVRSAFSQMYFVYDGLKAMDSLNRLGINYQALCALLFPFEANVSNRASSAKDAKDLKMKRALAYAAKKARNYCAHNNWGGEIGDKDTLYLLMLVLTAILEREQREQIKEWYWEARNLIIGNNNIPTHIDESKIDILIEDLWAQEPCRISDKCGVSKLKSIDTYCAKDYIEVLGWHTSMRKNKNKREKYYIFTLAVYIIKELNSITDNSVEEEYGYGVKTLYDISKLLVDNYCYDDPL